MEVRSVRLDSLHLDPANARQHDARNLAAIAQSLTAFGQQKPIVVDAAGLILAGNGTYQAAQSLRWTWIDTVVSTLEAVQARAYAVADNRTGELAAWDEDELARTLQDLLDAQAPVVGWDDDELTALLARLGAGEGMRDVQPDLEHAQELRDKWGVVRGQLWALASHRLLCGDATDPVDVKALLVSDKPLLMVTDPPYGVGYVPVWRAQALPTTYEAQTGHTSPGRRARPVANDDRVDWSPAWRLFPGDVAYTWSPGGDLVIQTGLALQTAGFQIRNQLVWRKPHFPISRGHYTYQHEPCWYAVRKGRQAHWIGQANASSVWDMALDANVEGGHSTQKPLEAMARPIRNHNSPLVYDPFLGSGTTLVACENLDRTCLGMDIDACYVAVCLERFLDLTGIQPVLLR